MLPKPHRRLPPHYPPEPSAHFSVTFEGPSVPPDTDKGLLEHVLNRITGQRSPEPRRYPRGVPLEKRLQGQVVTFGYRLDQRFVFHLY